MKTTLGLLGTLAIFSLALCTNLFYTGTGFLPSTFGGHTTMFLLSGLFIYIFRDQIPFRLGKIKLKVLAKAFLITLGVTFLSNFVVTFISLLLGSVSLTEKHFVFNTMDPWQIFIFVFLYASIAEEFLYRGFLQNMLSSLSSKAISLFGLRLSAPVLIAALFFGLSHLILINTGASGPFLIRIVVFTTCLGIIAGYFQEKYKNTTYAILIHMTGNLPGLISALILSPA